MEMAKRSMHHASCQEIIIQCRSRYSSRCRRDLLHQQPIQNRTKEQKLLATALDIMGFGANLSVVDALYMINEGDVEGLYSMLFSEVKGAIFDKVKAGSAYNELAVDLYTGMALAEKVGLDILKDQQGPIAAMEESIFKQLRNAFSWKPGQLVILRGYGYQKLFEAKEADEEKPEFEVALFWR